MQIRGAGYRSLGLLLLVVLGGVLILTACGDSATVIPAVTAVPTTTVALAPTTAPAPTGGLSPVGAKTLVSGSFVGRTKEDTNGFVGLVTNGKKLLFYVCDGTTDKVQIAQWFRGDLNADTQSFSLKSASGSVLEGKLSSESAAGVLKLDNGRELNFSAPAATGEAGVFRAEGTENSEKTIEGWIVLNDGTTRGAKLLGTKLVVVDPKARPALPFKPADLG